MNDSVLLLVPYVNHAITSNNFMPSLGVCYISSYLSYYNVKVEIIDNYLEKLDDEELLYRIRERSPLILGVYIPSRLMLYSFLSFFYKYYIELSDIGLKVVVGGPFATLAYQEILIKFNVVDFVVLGFGERTMLELYRGLTKNRDFKMVDNLAYYDKKAAKVLFNKIPEVLDPDIPIPDLTYYLKTFGKKMSYTVSCSRGCIGRCSFCIINLYYRNLCGKLSLSHIIEQTSHLINNGIREITFIDDNIFNSVIFEDNNFSVFLEFLRHSNIRFGISARIKEILEFKKHIMMLSEVGLDVIFTGIESFYNETLSLFNKGIRITDIFEMLEFTNKENIKITFGFIFFHPWSTPNEIKENLDKLEHILERYTHISGSSPIQELQIIYKTPLYYKAKRDGLLRGDVLTGFDYEFRDSAVKHIYKKWVNVNSDLLLSYMEDGNEKVDLVQRQILELRTILNEVIKQ